LETLLCVGEEAAAKRRQRVSEDSTP
jgi:hypothetical protein